MNDLPEAALRHWWTREDFMNVTGYSKETWRRYLRAGLRTYRRDGRTVVRAADARTMWQSNLRARHATQYQPRNPRCVPSP